MEENSFLFDNTTNNHQRSGGRRVSGFVQVGISSCGVTIDFFRLATSSHQMFDATFLFGDAALSFLPGTGLLCNINAG